MARFDPNLHPRGRDGEFIETLGLIKLVDYSFVGTDGKTYRLDGARARVDAISPDPRTPGNPNIRVRILRNGEPGPAITVKPAQVLAAPEKARIDEVRDTLTDWRKPTPIARPSRPPQPTGEFARLRAEQQELGLKARDIPDVELAEQAPTAGPVWRQAIQREQQKRARRRAAGAKERERLIAAINQDAALLSTTNGEDRADGLDAILSRLRFSPVDTNRIHDEIYPPTEMSGRWEPERAALHRQMWDEFLAGVTAANIPKGHDAMIMGGLPGSGKSTALANAADRFGVVAWEPGKPVPPGATHVVLNPDLFKQDLMDRGLLPAGIVGLKPAEQSTFLHAESAYLNQMFLERLGSLGYNIALDTTFDSESAMRRRMDPLDEDGYRFRGLFTDIPIDESRRSARQRYLTDALTENGGRFVASSVTGNRTSMRGSMSKNRDAFDDMTRKDWFDDWEIIDNTGVADKHPLGRIVDAGPGGEGPAQMVPIPTGILSSPVLHDGLDVDTAEALITEHTVPLLVHDAAIAEVWIRENPGGSVLNYPGPGGSLMFQAVTLATKAEQGKLRDGTPIAGVPTVDDVGATVDGPAGPGDWPLAKDVFVARNPDSPGADVHRRLWAVRLAAQPMYQPTDDPSLSANLDTALDALAANSTVNTAVARFGQVRVMPADVGDAAADYSPHVAIIRVGPEGGVDQIEGPLLTGGRDTWATDHSVTGVFRHEYGHHVYYQAMLQYPQTWGRFQEAYRVWQPVDVKGYQIYDQREDPEWAAPGLSRYARTNPAEGFAEVFSKVTHPDYDFNTEPEGPVKDMARAVLDLIDPDHADADPPGDYVPPTLVTV